ncbi:hypothetical protein ACFYOG_00175 [Streptomyces sp. NPDC007818]|uniref:hypothetical protein n=1 Tax=Streptomyces sp. NPDC007818 TaxID=3364780 RepID=UPI0036B405FA
MSVSFARGGFIVLAVTVSLAIAGCGADAEPKASSKPTATSQPPQQSNPAEVDPPSEAPAEILVAVKGQKGLELEVTGVERDAGGFLTIKGRLKNSSDSVSAIPAQTSGDETEVVKHGKSLGGATLVDSVGKKRYYVLRDTDGRPLTTTSLTTLGPGKSTAVFMQFPAPPASTTEVSFQLPTFEPATLKLS